MLPCRTRVVLVLHQLEARKTSNTGHLALRCLPNSDVVIRGHVGGEGREAPPRPATAYPWTDPSYTPVLLFPHEDARPISHWRDATLAPMLIIPDGTWPQAIRARRRVPGLDELPCATLPPGPPSAYRLRTDPRPGHVSTLEAIARALAILEAPEVGAHLEAFQRIAVERTLWSRGKLAAAEVTGGIPHAARRPALTSRT
jgi:DTW domain-containing protein YfiP